MVTFKSVLRSVGTTLVCFCASFIAFLFQGYRIDLEKLDVSAFTEYQQAMFDAQIKMSNLMIAITGGVLTSFAVLTMVYSILRYIDANRANMGILKAMGYSRIRIASEFLRFGLNTFVGTLFGYLLSLLVNPVFYHQMDLDGNFPEIVCSSHLGLAAVVVFVPTILFSLLAFAFAYLRLRHGPLEMIKGIQSGKARKGAERKTFLASLRVTILKSHLSLILFVGFSALCFGATVQMSFSMDQVTDSSLFFWMMLLIGLLLGVSVLYLSFYFVFTNNREYMTFLKAYGYTDWECVRALFSGYLMVSVLGFGLGTGYQYLLIQLMLKLFAEAEELEFNFSWPGFFYTLLIYIPIYAIINVYFYYQLKKTTIKQISKPE